MANLDIAHRRLHNQGLALARFDQPRDVVSWLGAVQAQDYAGAKWALGLRLRSATDAGVERAFAEGSILRTHLMRPTWHFVAPGDIRWLLALTAPRVNAANSSYYRQLELDETTLRRSNAALVRALRGGQQLTREQLRGVLRQAGIATESSMRMGYMMMRAELDGIVCSGARRGKQFTYALLDERAPQTKTLGRDEALAELAGRYFVSHGPATLQDFVWWSGLPMADARDGVEMAKARLGHETIDGQKYWLPTSTPPATRTSRAAYLLPNYDEFISYQDRGFIFDAAQIKNLVFSHLLVSDGLIVGTWKRTLTKGGVVIESNSFAPLTKAESRAVDAAALQYGAFLGLPAILA